MVASRCHDSRLFLHFLLDEDLILTPPTLIHYIFLSQSSFSFYVFPHFIHDKQEQLKEDHIRNPPVLQLGTPTVWRWKTTTRYQQVHHIPSLVLFIIMNRSIPHCYQYLLWRRSLRNDRAQQLIMGIVESNVDGTPHQLLAVLTIRSLRKEGVRLVKNSHTPTSYLILITGQINDLYCTSGKSHTIQPNLHLVKLILQETNMLLQSRDHGVLPNDELRRSSDLMIGIVIKTIHHLSHTLIQTSDLKGTRQWKANNQMSTSSPCLPS